MQLTNKEKTLLFILALVTALVVCIRFVMIPMFEKHTMLKVELEAAQQKQHEVQMLLSKLETIDGEIDKVVEATAVAAEPFFIEVEPEYLHKWAVKVAGQAHLQVNALSVGGKGISPIGAYGVQVTNQSYPIGDYYNNMVNSTTLEEQTAQEAPALPGEGSDAVIQMPVQLNVKGTKSNLIQFATNMANLGKHVVLQGLPLDNFDKDEEREVGLSLMLYAIDKEDDGVLGYEF